DLVEEGAGGELAAREEDEDVRTLAPAPFEEPGGEGGFADAAQAVDDVEPLAAIEHHAQAALSITAADVADGQIGDALDLELLAHPLEQRRDRRRAPPRSSERSRILPHSERQDRPLVRRTRRHFGPPGAQCGGEVGTPCERLVEA